MRKAMQRPWGISMHGMSEEQQRAKGVKVRRRVAEEEVREATRSGRDHVGP